MGFTTGPRVSQGHHCPSPPPPCINSPRASAHPWLHLSSKRTLPRESSGLPETAYIWPLCREEVHQGSLEANANGQGRDYGAPGSLRRQRVLHAGQPTMNSQFYLKERKPGTPPSSPNHELQASALAKEATGPGQATPGYSIRMKLLEPFTLGQDSCRERPGCGQQANEGRAAVGEQRTQV